MPLCVDQTVFLKTWLKIPMRTGATVPSSKVLARFITGDIVSNGGPVIELGPVADQKAVGSIALGQRADLQELDTDHPALLGLPVESLLDACEFSEPGPQPCRNRLADPQVTTDLPPCAPIGSSYCQERAGSPPLFKS